MFHVDGDEHLTCPIWGSIEEVMSVLTFAVPGATPRPVLFQGVVLGQRPPQMGISPSSHLQMRCS
jgi:hypothetical protein